MVDSGLYGVSLEEPEMHYLQEHWGECGAEAMNEQHAIDEVSSVMTPENFNIIRSGAMDFLDAVEQMWDVLSTVLLNSGKKSLNAA